MNVYNCKKKDASLTLLLTVIGCESVCRCLSFYILNDVGNLKFCLALITTASVLMLTLDNFKTVQEVMTAKLKIAWESVYNDPKW